MKKRFLPLLLTALLMLPSVALAAGEETELLPEIGFYSSQTRGGESCLSGQYNYLEHAEGERQVWLLSAEGFSDTEEPTVSLAWDFRHPTDGGMSAYSAPIEIPADCVQKVARAGSNPVVYDYRIDLSCVKTAMTKELIQLNPEAYLCRLSAQVGEQEAALEVAISHRETNGIPVGDGRYIVSVYNHLNMDDDESPIYMSGSWGYAGMVGWEYAGVLTPVNIEGNTEYQVAAQTEIQWTVDRIWLENIVGDGGTWSFAENEKVTELRNPVFPFDFYGRGDGCCTLVLYEVTVTYEGKTSTYVLGRWMDWMDNTPPPKLVRPDDDTVEKLNEDLLRMESGSVVTLGNTTYTGIIEVPESVGWISFQGAGADENDRTKKTILVGGISAGSGGVDASEIHFRGTETVTQAVTGSFNSMACSFTGYQVAIGTGQGGIQNVFIDNEVAVLVDDPSGWPSNSTFIQNKTAVKIVDLGSFYTPYQFRISECNFINNDVDFDVTVPGTFYFNKNYFGRLKHTGQGPTGWGDWSDLQQAVTQTSVNAVIGRRKAVIKQSGGARVVADAVFKYPVLYWWPFGCSVEEVFGPDGSAPAAYSMGYEPNYINALTADWDAAVRIADDEDVVIEAEAFSVETEGAKEITIMNEGDATVGTWSFGGGTQ